jgi:hypothetical protein
VIELELLVRVVKVRDRMVELCKRKISMVFGKERRNEERSGLLKMEVYIGG